MIFNTQIKNLQTLNQRSLNELSVSTDIFIYSNQLNLRATTIVDLMQSETSDQDTCSVQLFYDENITGIKKAILSQCETGQCRVTIDISCIAGDTLAELFYNLSKFANQCEINVKILYTLAKYIEPKKENSFNKTVSPAHRAFSGWLANPQFPILAIVGLGYESDKAVGAVEYLDASEEYIFVPNSSEIKYKDKVEEVNKNFIRRNSENKRFDYIVEDPVYTIHTLNSLLVAAKKEFKPVLLPFGPKIFFACALVVALANPEASVWYVSGQKNDTQHDEQEVASIIGFEFSLTTEMLISANFDTC